MYSYIKGTLEVKEEGQVVIDNHGIGYLIQIPVSIEQELPSVGKEVKLYTYLHIKEDAISLIGFLRKESLTVFKLLLGVNGIGPKAALAILSALSLEELRFAILAGDSKTIAKAPGVGAKSAQRIILELKDKMNLEDIAYEKTEDSSVPAAETSTVKLEAAQALEVLGYSPAEAMSAVAKAEPAADADVEAVLKAALKQMAFL